MSNKARMALVVFCLVGGAPAIAAECRFKSPDALMCRDSEMAAIAYQEYGFDSALIRQSYSMQLLYESGCLTVTSNHANYKSYKREWKPLKIEEVSRGKIATTSGWVGVHHLKLTLDHSPVHADNVAGKQFAYYVADGYIEGQCPKTQKLF